jgi:N-acetylmuramoyl-L-alanine amidase
MKVALLLRGLVFGVFLASGCVSSKPSGTVYVIDRTQPGAPAVPVDITRASVHPPVGRAYTPSPRARTERPVRRIDRPRQANLTRRIDLSGRLIVVDPGHGGKDPGAPGVGPMVEKSVNLQVAWRLASGLRARGARVIMTRDTDRFISLDARAEMADRTRADLFVSIHADACARPEVSGATLYIARGASSASRATANRLESAIKMAGFSCRGVREAGFRVLVGHSRPAVLVECGYLTNRTEAHRLAQPDHQQRLADALTLGIAQQLVSR